MKKGLKTYLISWAVSLIIFNIIVFVIPNSAGGMNKFGGAFWSGYVLITLTFIGQLICAYFVFKTETKEQLFLNLPVIRIIYSTLIAAVIVGGIVMAVPDLPNWAGVVVGVLLLGFCAIAVMKANAAAMVVNGIENKLKAETQFIKFMTADAEALYNGTESENLKGMIKEVLEALKFSDPMSASGLIETEEKIENRFNDFASAVNSNDEDLAKTYCDELLWLISIRNKKCKILK